MTPDIAMCTGVDSNNNECKTRELCYRYLAEPDYRQSYILIEDWEKCGHYWNCESKSMKRRLDEQNEG